MIEPSDRSKRSNPRFLPLSWGIFAEIHHLLLEFTSGQKKVPPIGGISVKLDRLVRYHRKAASLSQAELSSLAGVSRKIVQNLEAGNTKVSWENVLAVLRTLNISLEPTGPLVDRWRKSEAPAFESKSEATHSTHDG